MADPFPGIDPYVEASGYWEDFHLSFLPYCRDTLNDLLPAPYEARLGEHLHLMERAGRQAQEIHPDVSMTKGDRRSSRGTARRAALGGTLTLEPVTIPLPSPITEVRDVWIEIRRRPKRIPVAVIELLSPTNKTGDGFWEYKSKRRSLIRQRVHLVEFDFLLGGRRLPMGRPLPPGDYYALVSRAERRPDCEVYAWAIRDPLPTIPIPLLAPDPDVVLDLGALFATAYKRGHYAGSIDYTTPLVIVKKPEDRAWAEQIARRWRR
jgi:hypothetical protein